MSEIIRHEITLPASPDAVFAALTEEGRFAEMTGQAATIEPCPGGAFSRFGDQVTGRIVEYVPGERLIEAWRVAPWSEGKYSVVRFDLSATDSGTRLVLEQDGYPADNREHLVAGWEKMYLQPLAAMFG